MNDYYDAMAKQEMFDEQWVSRDDYNDLLDRCQSLEEEIRNLEKLQKERLDPKIEEIDELTDVLDKIVLKLRRSSENMERSTDLILDQIETALDI